MPHFEPGVGNHLPRNTWRGSRRGGRVSAFPGTPRSVGQKLGLPTKEPDQKRPPNTAAPLQFAEISALIAI